MSTRAPLTKSLQVIKYPHCQCQGFLLGWADCILLSKHKTKACARHEFGVDVHNHCITISTLWTFTIPVLGMQPVSKSRLVLHHVTCMEHLNKCGEFDFLRLTFQLCQLTASPVHACKLANMHLGAALEVYCILPYMPLQPSQCRLYLPACVDARGPLGQIVTLVPLES
jgi:hypothetical protein